MYFLYRPNDLMLIETSLYFKENKTTIVYPIVSLRGICNLEKILYLKLFTLQTILEQTNSNEFTFSFRCNIVLMSLVVKCFKPSS